MTTRHLLQDAGHCLRAAVPAVLTLGVLTAMRSVFPASPTLGASAGALLLACHVATVAAGSWLVAAVGWAASRRWRDGRASRRLHHLRDLAAEPNRALVHLQTTLWSAAAGQHAVVVNVATGIQHRVWIAEMTVPIGAFVVLERTHHGAVVIGMMHARAVEAAHRHARRHSVTSDPLNVNVPPPEPRDDVLQLIEETEQYLREQGPRS